MVNVEQSVSHLVLEEYKALRAEALRSAGIISTTVWVGISGFIVTGGAGAAVARVANDHDRVFATTVIVLLVQSLGATVMFLSEYWKYMRVGIYIRSKIEDHFMFEDASARVYPLGWEHWIQGKRRAAWFPIVSVLVLQIPVIAAPVLIILGLAFPLGELWMPRWGLALLVDPLLASVLVLMIFANFAMVGTILISVLREVKKLSGERLAFNRQLVTFSQE